MKLTYPWRAPRRNALRRSGIGVALLSLAISAGCGGTGEATGSGADSSTVRVAFVPSTPWLPIMVAESKGFFEKNGLHVKITKVDSSPVAAIGRQFDIAQATGTDFAQAVNGGLDLRMVSNVAGEVENTTALLVSADSGIKSPGDLAGKRIGVSSSNSTIAQSILYLVKQDGGDPDSVTMQEMPFSTMADQLSSGRVDAVAAVEPFASQIEHAGGIRLLNPIYAAAQQAGSHDFVGSAYVATTEKYAAAHSAQIHAWRTSLKEAIEYIASHQADARQILAEFTGLPAAVARSAPLYDYNADPVTAASVQTWITVLEGSGTLPKDNHLDPKELVLD